jgi:hypothetical protein
VNGGGHVQAFSVWASIALLSLVGGSTPLRAADAPTYWQDVRATLRKHCTVCHNPRNLDEPDVSGGLTLDTYPAVLRWKRRLLVRPGMSAKSLLYRVVVTTKRDRRMPLGGKPLPAEAVTLLRRWIDEGAKEGKRPAETTPIVRPPRRRRKLDVTLATTLVPPRAAFAPLAPGPLQLVLRVGPLAPVVALAFSPDGKFLVSGAYGRVTVWELKAVRPVKVLTNVLGAVNDLRFSPDGKLLAVAGGQPSAKGDLRLFRVADWKLKAVLPGHEDVVAGVAFRPDGKKLASASFDKTVRTWDLGTLKQERALTMHSDFVHAVSYSPDGKWLASASKDRTVRVVNADSGAGRFTFSGMEQDVLAVAFSKDGKRVVSSGNEPGLSWWDAEKGGRLRVRGGHSVAVHELALGRDGKVLASAGGDGNVILWNEASGAQVRVIRVGSLVYAVALSPDGKTVAAGSFDGLVRLYDTGTSAQRATLLSLPPEKGQAEWLALTPQGYADASAGVVGLGRWRMGGKDLPAGRVWKALRMPEAVSKVVGGGKVAGPVFGK